MNGRTGTGLLAGLVVAALAAVLMRPPPVIAAMQERVFDLLLTSFAPQPVPSVPVIVVDIAETDEEGRPWRRAATARLVERVAAAQPKLLGFDIVYSGDCAAGPENAQLAAALGRVPSVIGFLLSGQTSAPPGDAPSIAVGHQAASGIWSAPGAEGPCPGFAEASTGVAALSLAGDADGVVRRVPAVVAAGGTVYPSLAAELSRQASGGGTMVLVTDKGGTLLRLAGHSLPLDREAQIRFVPRSPAERAGQTISALQILSEPAEVWRGRVANAIVLIGSGLPQAGGLRATATSPLSPSVQIQAELTRGVLSGQVPHRAEQAGQSEVLIAAASALTAIALILFGPGLAGVFAVPAFALIWAGASVYMVRTSLHLVDLSAPLAILLTGAGVAMAGKAWVSGRAEEQLRRKMRQLLPAAVVSQIAANPGLLRQKGERRDVTAMMTDIEGFSDTTRQAGPEVLVRLLDRYFALTSDIVLRHGGMIDKLVGDSIHALFNAPLDQPGHADAALACAAEIHAATEALRLLPEMRAAGLGRTRIGIETGAVVLGDVGSGARIDYTAHGDAVNIAARLEALNKDLGTWVCIGPGTAERATTALHPMGETEVRSFGRLALFTLISEPGTGKGGLNPALPPGLRR